MIYLTGFVTILLAGGWTLQPRQPDWWIDAGLTQPTDSLPIAASRAAGAKRLGTTMSRFFLPASGAAGKLVSTLP